MKVLSLAFQLSFLLLTSSISHALPTTDEGALFARTTTTTTIDSNDNSWRQGCNGPSTRDINSCGNRGSWGYGFDINTDYEKKWPRGVVRCFDLTISQKTIYPDGYAKDAMVVNGQYPGPPIIVNWGDTVRVKVTNRLNNGNGTTIHWHGIRQLNSNLQDGVPGVTQCPIMPGSSQVYEFVATQYGSSWYHSHFAVQYPDGIAGPLIIRGPTSADYDEDLGPFAMTDWLHASAFSQSLLDFQGTLPRSDSVLFNGKGIYNCSTTDPLCKPERGGLTEVTIQKGKKYKMHLISMAIDTQFTFWIDGHDFTVVANDFVAIQPYKTDTINLGPGQRYEIILEAKADICDNKNFWINLRQCTGGGGFRPPPTSGGNGNGSNGNGGTTNGPATLNSPLSPNVIAGTPLNGTVPEAAPIAADGPTYPANRLVKRQGGPGGPGGGATPANSHLGILRYAGGRGMPPSLNDTRTTFGCMDPPANKLVPVVSKRVGADKDGKVPQFEAGQFPWPNINDTGSKLHSWALGYASLKLNWSEPTVKLIDEGKAIPREYVPITLDNNEGDWNYFLILDNFTQPQSNEPTKVNGPTVPHPIHLHGHDFSVIAQSNSSYDASTLKLNLDNPPRRDVATLPAGGYLVIAFQTDNPGSWLIHCHIAWHANAGMGFNFIEMPDKIKNNKNTPLHRNMQNQCKQWTKYYNGVNLPDEGSGV